MNDDKNTTEPVTGEVVSETQDDTGGAVVLQNLESMIKSHISRIDKIKEENKKFKEMLDSIFENDSVYKDHAEKAKEAAKVKSQTKQQILKQPQAADLNDKIKGSRGELKELQTALSDYLKEFQRMSGVNEIEDEDGTVREIVYVAKLVKRSKR